MNCEDFQYKGFVGSVNFSDKDAVFFGKIEGIDGLVTFEGRSLSELEEAFHKAVDDYRYECRQAARSEIQDMSLDEVRQESLVREPIEDEEQYRKALRRIEVLATEVTEDMPEDDSRKVEYRALAELVADYSDEHFDLNKPNSNI